MNVGDIITVWLRDDPRTITGTITEMNSSWLNIRCDGDDGGSTTWQVWAKDILTIGIITLPPSRLPDVSPRQP